MATSDVLPTMLEIWGAQKPQRASADKLPRNVLKPISKPRKASKRPTKKDKR